MDKVTAKNFSMHWIFIALVAKFLPKASHAEWSKVSVKDEIELIRFIRHIQIAMRLSISKIRKMANFLSLGADWLRVDSLKWINNWTICHTNKLPTNGSSVSLCTRFCAEDVAKYSTHMQVNKKKIMLMVMRNYCISLHTHTQNESRFYLTQLIVSPIHMHARVYYSSNTTLTRETYLLKTICGKSFRLLFPIYSRQYVYIFVRRFCCFSHKFQS